MSFPRLTGFLPVFLLSLFSAPWGSETRSADTPSHVFFASEQWAASVTASMSIEEKVGQLIMARTFGHYISEESDEFRRLTDLIQNQKIGGVVVFQGDVYETAVLLNNLQQRSKLPLLVAADFERGAAMRIRRSTLFPEAMAVGATRNSLYAYEIGKAIAEEGRAMGIHQNLAPVADVNNNPANPVINTRSFGEDPKLVSDMVEAFVHGTNDGGALSTAKHFPGHGDTGTDSHLDLPVLTVDRGRLDSVELPSFRRAIKSGVSSVMIAHLEVPFLDPVPGRPATLSPNAVADLLRKELGFDGLVVTDAMEMRGILKNYSVGESAVMAVKAGVDIILVPADEVLTFEALLRAVTDGEISMRRLDESVTRILTLKKKLGLMEQRLVRIEDIARRVATAGHLVLAKRTARDAITLLRNDGGIVPLDLRSKKVALVTVSDVEEGRVDVHRPSVQATNELPGAYFSSLFRERAGSIAHFRVNPGSNPDELRETLTKLGKYDLLVLAIYAKVRSSTGKADLPETLRGFVDSLSAVPTPGVVVSFGNPYLTELFPKAPAILCGYSDAEVMAEAMVEALFGKTAITGKLPISVPGSFTFGDGVSVPQSFVREDHPLAGGFDPGRLRSLDTVITQAIQDSAFPGAQLAVIRDGALVYNEAFGNLTYDPVSRPVTASTMFDLASVTKVVATTMALMKLYDDGMFSLDDPVADFIPSFAGGEKDRVTIRHLLAHRSGLPAYRDFYHFCASPEQLLDSLYATRLVAQPGDTTIYSDLGMTILGKVVEAISGSPFDEYFRQNLFEPLGMRSTMFLPPESRLENIAPTEEDRDWRKQLVQGRVHDENAELLGGVSGHAGLFSTASDLAVFVQMILNGGTYGGRRYVNESTLFAFTTRQPGSSSRGLGWDLKSSRHSTAGNLFSPASFGHTGFTGTTIWIDPQRKIGVIFLTNRIYPTRENTRINRIRPKVHDTVIRALIESS